MLSYTPNDIWLRSTPGFQSVIIHQYYSIQAEKRSELGAKWAPGGTMLGK